MEKKGAITPTLKVNDEANLAEAYMAAWDPTSSI